jgi:hypothetical protein
MRELMMERIMAGLGLDVDHGTAFSKRETTVYPSHAKDNRRKVPRHLG